MIFIIISSCGQNSSEKKLNGKWFELENEYATWEFYSDSLIFGTEFKYNFEWEASDADIKFDYITYSYGSEGKQIKYEDKIVIDYNLNNDNDSLFGTLRNKYGIHKFSMLKTKSYTEYLNKKFQIIFSLPQNKKAEPIKDYGFYGLKVFIGTSNNKIIGRTELSENLNNIESDIKIFKDSISPSQHPLNHAREISEEEHKRLLDRRFHLRVFADKTVPDSTITKYLSVTVNGDSSIFNEVFTRFKVKLPHTVPIRIIRIYNKEEEIDPWNINGIEIKTIANNLYN